MSKVDTYTRHNIGKNSTASIYIAKDRLGWVGVSGYLFPYIFLIMQTNYLICMLVHYHQEINIRQKDAYFSKKMLVLLEFLKVGQFNDCDEKSVIALHKARRLN